MINEKYSYKDLSGIDYTNFPESDFSGEIVGSYFYQENLTGLPNRIKIFPTDIVTNFVRCNLDNIEIPVGANLYDCCNRLFISDETGDHEWL